MNAKAVLVVEDDPMLRTDASDMLQEAGFYVVELDNGDDALSYIVEQSREVAAVFTDVQMPGDADGLYLAEAVARNWPHIKVLVTSGHIAAPRDLPKGVRFVPKPWLPREVISALQDAQTVH